jgi:glutamate synthase (NADPH) small chain
MGKVTGFLEIDRQEQKYQSASDRIRHSNEFTLALSVKEIERQAARCMDCGVPYCHTGCPVNNQIPDWNDLVFNEDWQEALANLHSTNNFPEFTGRVCPAPCEEACTLNLEDIPVSIKNIEQAIIDKGFENGWVKPEIAKVKTGKKIAVIGAGSAGLAAAQQLARVGHEVHVYEREAKAGGLLRYGIPDFKLEKHTIDRRLKQLEAEGIQFHYNANIGVTHKFSEIEKAHDAVLMTGGAEDPRNPNLPGQNLEGCHYAMPFLAQQNKRIGDEAFDEEEITAGAKHIVVIGGGDTASDCIGTSFRQGALSVTQLDIRPKPGDKGDTLNVWPYWQTKMRTSSSQAEGAGREFQIATLEIVGKNGKVTGVKCAKVDEKRVPLEGSEFIIKADAVFLAIGFAGSETKGMVEQSKVTLDKRNNVVANDREYKTSRAKVYVAGDMRRGQSLIVWAIREGRQAARAIDLDLMGKTVLPR